MKKVLTFLILVSSALSALGQSQFSFNQGGTNQGAYNSTIPYENVNGKLIVNVVIKGKKYRFILDTGAPTSISSKVNDELKPTLITKLPISDANDKVDSLLVVQLNEFGLGDVVFNQTPCLVIKKNDIFDCYNVDGFIGSNLLRNSIIQINNISKTLILTNDANKINVNKKQSSDMILDRQSSPIISVLLINKSKAKELLLLDLGMNGFYDLSQSHLKFFQQYDLFEVQSTAKGNNALGLFGLAKDTIQFRLQLPELKINGTIFANVKTETTLDENSRIGSKILDYGITTIDYKNKKFYFEPFTKNKVEMSEKQFPIALVPKNNGIYVGFVWDASITNVSVGDQILLVDDTACENMNICDVMATKLFSNDKVKNRLVTRNSQGQTFENIIEKK